MLSRISRASGHELRNTLNALVVNLEVVRSRSHVGDPGSAQFIEQSVQQCEESVRVAESVLALMEAVVSSIGPRGEVSCELASSRGIRLNLSPAAAARAERKLKGLVSRGVITADTSDAAVILSIPASS